MDLEKLEQEELIARWQRHRERCLKLAAKLGASSPEQAIEMAEALGGYILNGATTAPAPSSGPARAGSTATRSSEA